MVFILFSEAPTFCPKPPLPTSQLAQDLSPSAEAESLPTSEFCSRLFYLPRTLRPCAGRQPCSWQPGSNHTLKWSALALGCRSSRSVIGKHCMIPDVGEVGTQRASATIYCSWSGNMPLEYDLEYSRS
jgi:hypothetical protein